jgi:hypothetical protein
MSGAPEPRFRGDDYTVETRRDAQGLLRLKLPPRMGLSPRCGSPITLDEFAQQLGLHC